MVDSTLKNHQIYTANIREKWRKAMTFRALPYSSLNLRHGNFHLQRFNICGYTLDKCKAIYFNSDIILVRHIFLHYFLKASCLANDRWLLGVLFFCLLSTTLLEPITLLRRTTPYLVFLIDLKWVVYVGITQDQWLLHHFYCHLL